MSNKVDFSKIISLMKVNEDFSITESQYLKNTGREMPKNTWYLKNSSAFSKIAEKYGYTIEVKERTVLLKKK